ncbi:MAG: hypothetical protein OXI43_00900 [Candidatus Poribacteria bacterium]|nr:hypothetical protein [Candidatus Poribacteria bacterium]
MIGKLRATILSLTILSLISIIGCSSKYAVKTNNEKDLSADLQKLIVQTDLDSHTDLDTFQFIITFSSDNILLLREASIKYNQKADSIRRTDKQYYSNVLYKRYREWSTLLNQKANMVEMGHLNPR